MTALPGNPYDGHTLGTVIPQMQALIGDILDRCITDAGYHGHNAPSDHKFKVHTSGQKRRLAAITLPMPAAMPSTPCSPPPATTFAASSHG